MFDNNNKIFAYKISLQLDQHLVALFNLCYDINIRMENITVENNEILYASQLFKESFYNLLDINKDELTLQKDGKYIYSKDEFFENLAAQLNSYYLKSDQFIEKLNSKEFLYYLKDSFILYSTFENSKEVTNNINSKFKSLKIISALIENLESSKLKEAIASISTIYEFDKSGQFVKVPDTLLKPQLFKIPVDYLDDNLIIEEIFDIDNFWINLNTQFTQQIQFDFQADDVFLIKDKNLNKTIGLKINGFILLKYDVDFTKYIKKEFANQFIWDLFKENIFREKTNNLSHSSELINEFKAKSKDCEFNKLLSNLKQNLYIDRSINIQDAYRSFFEEFIMITKLDELSNLNLFLPDDEGDGDMIGIYTEEKIGKKYNLLHHIKHKDSKSITKFVNSNPTNEKKIKVNILKAELSFYLVEKYFEDIVEGLLKDNNVDFISNVELCINRQSKAEFDFIIFTNNEFLVLEAKTTLSRDNVYQTLKKFNENINLLKQITNSNVENFKFKLLGLLSNSNLDNYKHFFIDKVYNSTRKDYYVTPYKFKVPFFNHQDLELECIAEPELSKLNDYIKEICQI